MERPDPAADDGAGAVDDPDGAILRSLTDRLEQMYGEELLERTLRNLGSDLIGTTDPIDLPADCRAWVDTVLEDVARDAARACLHAMLPALAHRLAGAPDDLAGCALMRHVARAQAIHVTEVG
jgi:hypothetical protein